MEDYRPEEDRPSWARNFMKLYLFRVSFGKLPDGREPVAKVQVVSWNYGNAKLHAIWTARSLFRNDPMVQHAKAKAEGYPIKKFSSMGVSR